MEDDLQEETTCVQERSEVGNFCIWMKASLQLSEGSDLRVTRRDRRAAARANDDHREVSWRKGRA